MIVVYIGPRASVAGVRDAVGEHARWLGVPTQELQPGTGAEPVVYAAWDPRGVDDEGRRLVIGPPTGGGPVGHPPAEDPLGDSVARIHIDVRPAEASVFADVPVATSLQVVHADFAGGWLLTDDLRLVRRLLRPALAEASLQALLKWGSVPAPFTVLEGVSRVPPGTTLSYDGRTRQQRTTSPWQARAGVLRAERPAVSLEEAAAQYIEALDPILARLPAGSTLLFSGGTDTPYLATRLAHLGVTDLHLVHLEFREMPDETEVATAFARILGYPFHRRVLEPAHALRVLEQAARLWPSPFGDTSLIAGHAVMEMALGLGSRVVIDATGPYGFRPRQVRGWTLPARLLPGPAVALAAWLYRTTTVWHSEPSGFEKLLRAGARLHGVPLPHAATVQNLLDGIAYAVPGEVAGRMAAAMDAVIEELPGGRRGREAFETAEIVHVHANRWLAKLTGPASAAGASIMTPFLNDRLIGLRLRTINEPWQDAYKVPLRMAMTERLPADLVYRPKSPFITPMAAVLALPEVREQVAAAIEPGSPLGDLVRPAPVGWLLAQAAKGRLPSTRQAGFLWTLAFAGRWLRDTGQAP